MTRTGLLSLAALILFSAPVHAAEDRNVESYKKQIISLNKNIGTYYFISDTIMRPIQDSDHQQVGSVQDFLINHQGEVEKIVGELNNMANGKTILSLNFDDLSQSKDSFMLAYKAAEMEEQLASYLANLETAAGDDAEDLISARRLQGRRIVLPSGEAIGEVEQVITDRNTKTIVGVLMKDLNQRPAYERFALPYPNGLSVKNTGFESNLEIAGDYADIVQDFTAEGLPN
jgi:sporulation protein YlmC with PRC-barrel domain